MGTWTLWVQGAGHQSGCMGPDEDVVLDEGGFDALISELRVRGFRTSGPVVRGQVILHGEVSSADDLPRGWRDQQAPGRYRLEQTGGPELFGWAVGPTSWKSEFFPPEDVVWRASADGCLLYTSPSPRD